MWKHSTEDLMLVYAKHGSSDMCWSICFSKTLETKMHCCLKASSLGDSVRCGGDLHPCISVDRLTALRVCSVAAPAIHERDQVARVDGPRLGAQQQRHLPAVTSRMGFRRWRRLE